MTTQVFSSRTVLTLATLAACLAASTAHAGVLGGAGSTLGATVGPRSLDIGGQARAGLQRDAVALPSGDKLRETTGAATGQVGQAKDAATAKGAQVQADAHASAQANRDAAVDQAASAKASADDKLRQSADQVRAQVGNTKAAVTGKAGQVRADANAAARASGSSNTPRGNASVSASGDANVSRSERSANASVSGDTSVRR